PRPACELAARGVAPRQRHLAIDQNQRQRVLPGALEKALDDGVLRALERLLREVEAFDRRPLLTRPVDVGREVDQRRVDPGATLRGLEHLNALHAGSPLSATMAGLRKPNRSGLGRPSHGSSPPPARHFGQSTISLPSLSSLPTNAAESPPPA